MKTVLITAAVLLAPAAAHADQCQLLDDAVADRVRAVMAKPMRVAELCEPCGEKVPGLPFLPRSVDIIGSELVLDGTPRDLAYTYVKTASNKFENLAMLVGCPVEDVSPSLRVDAETPNGELIRADTTPVRRLAEPDVAVPLPSPPLPPPPPEAPPTYYSTTIVYAVPWVAIAAVAGGAGFLLGVIAALIAVGLRRRRAMTPRAAAMKL
jgi:hypothetical protein